MVENGDSAERTFVPGTPGPDARMWAMICHLAGLAGFLPVIPGIGSVLGPLIVWLVKRDLDPFIDEQGKEALNFQITMLIAGLIALILTLVFIGLILLPILIVVDIVFVVLAAIEAKAGGSYRYPVSIRLVN